MGVARPMPLVPALPRARLAGRTAPSLAATAATAAATQPNLKPYLQTLLDGESLSVDEAEAVCTAILQGANELQVASLLMLLRRNGESPATVAGFVRAMTKACVPVTVTGKMLDIVGTGGDGAHTINISTAAAILAAACGCKTAKAGNRSVSSKCGSADVLEALGVSLELSAEQVGDCVERCGMGFMYAPVNHPAMRVVAPIRKALGIRSIFNLLGPLTNAAGAQHVVIGVFTEDLLDLMADSLMEIGRVEHGVVVYGVGLDEISPLGPATILEIKNTAPPGEPKKYTKRTFQFDPLDVGVPRCVVDDLKGGDAEENAAALRDVLAAGDHTDAKRDAVVLNAGFGCFVFGLADSIEDGVALARSTLQTGAGLDTLNQWVSTTQELAGK